MSSDSIVVGFDVFKNRGFQVAPLPKGGSRPGLAMNKFFLDGSEEALRDCVVPRVAFAAHAYFNLVFLQFIQVQFTGVLTSAVRMMEQREHLRTLRKLTAKRAAVVLYRC
jgi:hypothetical protein